MAQLLYKTRAGVSPQGKPRVYFACHEQDHTGYFEEICSEILKISDCAIFYYEPGEKVEQDEDYFLNLNGMNLFVMPVTTRLLYMPSRAMDVEFCYAVEHHIPVLPLMQEKDLDKQYKKKFGDLQFLDKTNADPTAIPYAEKLKKYLESVLIGDELAQKIRAAFDAYVFLSYRKKDRKYAQKLMRLLHRDPVCRDIAIWYDEFLIPGEDFNDSIRQALDKSKLFVLTVTPNLVNEPNYIIEHEYPMAKDAGKPILPAEMVATDADALQNSYPDIPQSICPDDEQTLTAIVLNALGTLARRENNNEPMHNFFIGLAYLSGVDVEVNHERAVELITGAAEAGLTEAMEKLVSMYEAGEGVQWDYHKAFEWEKRLVEQARALYEQKETDETAQQYFSKLLRLAVSWQGIAPVAQSVRFYEKVYEIVNERWQRKPSAWLACDLSSCCDRLGDCYLFFSQEENVEKAKEWYAKGLEIRECYAEDGIEDIQYGLYLSYERYGYICQTEGDFATAKRWHTRSAEICESLIETCESDRYKSLTDVYLELGNCCMVDRKLFEAKMWYTKFASSREPLFLSDNFTDMIELAICYRKLGWLCEREEDLVAAKEWYTKQREILERIEQIKAAHIDGDLAACYQKLGDISEEEGNLVDAKKWQTMSMEIRENLVREGKVEVRRDLSVSYERVGSICETEGDRIAARSWYMKYVEICESMAQTATTQSYDDLALSYIHLGLLDDNRGLLNKALKIYLTLTQKCPDVAIYAQRLQFIMEKLKYEQNT